MQEAISNKDRGLQAKVQQYANQIQEYAAEVQRYSNEVNEEIQTATVKLQRETEEYRRAEADMIRLKVQYDEAFIAMGAPARQEGGR